MTNWNGIRFTKVKQQKRYPPPKKRTLSSTAAPFHLWHPHHCANARHVLAIRALEEWSKWPASVGFTRETLCKWETKHPCMHQRKKIIQQDHTRSTNKNAWTPAGQMANIMKKLRIVQCMAISIDGRPYQFIISLSLCIQYAILTCKVPRKKWLEIPINNHGINIPNGRLHSADTYSHWSLSVWQCNSPQFCQTLFFKHIPQIQQTKQFPAAGGFGSTKNGPTAWALRGKSKE